MPRITFRKLINKYFQSFVFFYRRLRFKVFISLGLSIAVGFMDGFGLTLFLPLLKIAGGGDENGKDGLGKLDFLVTGMEDAGIGISLLSVLTVMVIFFLFKGISLYVKEIYNVKLGQSFISQIRIDLSKSLSEMSYKAFMNTDAGRIQNTMSGEVSRVSNAFKEYFNTLQQGIMVAVYMLFAFFIDGQFAILIIIGAGLTNFIFTLIYKSTKKSSEKVTAGSHIYQSLLLQFVSNFKYLKATGNIQKFVSKLVDGIKYIEKNNYKVGKLSSIINATREPILIFIVATVILVQVNFLNGELATILLSLLFFYRALNSLMFMQTAYNGFLTVFGSMQNLQSFQSELGRAKERTEGIEFDNFHSEIKLSNILFSYGNKKIFEDFNLTIKKNETVAFVGESGSGKTTLVNILVGLLETEEGKFIIDNKNIRDIDLRSYQRRIGYITQEPVIFNDSIFNNVTFWAERNEENINRFWSAIKNASIEDFVNSLDGKENTELGSKGIDLSGGQKQRISIARELYKDVDILVLDEATSALDSETEIAIQKGFEELKGKFTILIVAHRLATIKSADNIILLEDGRILDSGNFNELQHSSIKFRRMVSLQEL